MESCSHTAEEKKTGKLESCSDTDEEKKIGRFESCAHTDEEKDYKLKWKIRFLVCLFFVFCFFLFLFKIDSCSHTPKTRKLENLSLVHTQTKRRKLENSSVVHTQMQTSLTLPTWRPRWKDGWQI